MSVGPAGTMGAIFFLGIARFMALTTRNIQNATIIKLRMIVRKFPHAITAHTFLASVRVPITAGLPKL